MSARGFGLAISLCPAGLRLSGTPPRNGGLFVSRRLFDVRLKPPIGRFLAVPAGKMATFQASAFSPHPDRRHSQDG